MAAKAKRFIPAVLLRKEWDGTIYCMYITTVSQLRREVSCLIGRKLMHPAELAIDCDVSARGGVLLPGTMDMYHRIEKIRESIGDK